MCYYIKKEASVWGHIGFPLASRRDKIHWPNVQMGKLTLSLKQICFSLYWRRFFFIGRLLLNVSFSLNLTSAIMNSCQSLFENSSVSHPAFRVLHCHYSTAAVIETHKWPPCDDRVITVDLNRGRVGSPLEPQWLMQMHNQSQHIQLTNYCLLAILNIKKKNCL